MSQHVTDAIAHCRTAISNLWPIKTSPHLTKAKAEIDAAISALYQANGGEDEASSGLALDLPEAEAEVVALAEEILLRSLTVKEAYYLGQMVQGYTPQRTRTALLGKKRAKDPIRFAYADLQRKRYGGAAPKKDVAVEKTNYAMPADDWDAFA